MLAARSGLGSPQDYLFITSRHITDLQTKQPGRLVVGLVLDAHIRRRTNGKKSMDDVIRLEYQRWSGARGYTAADFAQTASDAAGFDLKPLLHKLVRGQTPTETAAVRTRRDSCAS